MKTMVALGIPSKDEDFRQLKSCMEMLETQNAYLLEVVTWLTCRHGGVFYPLIGGLAKGESFVAVDRAKGLEP